MSDVLFKILMSLKGNKASDILGVSDLILDIHDISCMYIMDIHTLSGVKEQLI